MGWVMMATCNATTYCSWTQSGIEAVLCRLWFVGVYQVKEKSTINSKVEAGVMTEAL